MGRTKGVGQRREGIRDRRPDKGDSVLARLFRPEHQLSVFVAVGFAICAAAILMLRPQVVGWRVGQYAPHDIVARTDFAYHDQTKLDDERRDARLREPHVYTAASEDPFAKLQAMLSVLPDRVKNLKLEELQKPLSDTLDRAAVTKLQDFSEKSQRTIWQSSVDAYTADLRNLHLMILPDAQRATELNRFIRTPDQDSVRFDDTLSPSMAAELRSRITTAAQKNFSTLLAPKILDLTVGGLTPNYEIDSAQTTQAQNQAAARVPDSAGDTTVKANMIFVERGDIDQSEYTQLKAEHDAYIASLGSLVIWQRVGIAATVSILTVIGSFYIATFQPRILRNHSRALGLASLMLSMLLLAQLTGLGSTRSYMFGLAPTLLVAMILAIAYDQRFAMGMAGLHAILATFALGEGLDFLMIQITGVLTCCFLLDDVRTRSKLVEIGGACAMAMIAATVASGWLDMEPMGYIVKNSIYSGAAGLAVGFLTLGILPFIERVFKITTSMTLLELADASHPLLRRLSLEAPGTYNHSLQVAALSEEAAEAIGGNSLLCRVAAYYHDVGKINKAEYFVENQGSGQNRHMHLSPSVSLLIIIGHVKDGVELAKEYNLPNAIMPFIQQHHGTTLVEFFYHRARKDRDCTPIEKEAMEHQYRYPGPKPRSKEVAIVMLADACESACRSMDEPNSARIETLVHELAMKRLLDGQFDQSELTMRELELIERSLVKSLLGLYHGRIAYPSDKPAAVSQTQPLLTPTVAAAG